MKVISLKFHEPRKAESMPVYGNSNTWLKEDLQNFLHKGVRRSVKVWAYELHCSIPLKGFQNLCWGRGRRKKVLEPHTHSFSSECSESICQMLTVCILKVPQSFMCWGLCPQPIKLTRSNVFFNMQDPVTGLGSLEAYSQRTYWLHGLFLPLSFPCHSFVLSHAPNMISDSPWVPDHNRHKCEPN